MKLTVKNLRNALEHIKESDDYVLIKNLTEKALSGDPFDHPGRCRHCREIVDNKVERQFHFDACERAAKYLQSISEETYELPDAEFYRQLEKFSPPPDQHLNNKINL